MKYLYKTLAMILLFGISIFIFGHYIPNINISTATATILHDSTFPLLSIEIQEHIVNQIHGYSSDMDSGQVRESITPLDTEKTFTAIFQEKNGSIKKLDYELKDIQNNTELVTGSVTAFNQTKSQKKATITLDCPLETSKEYGLCMILTTNLSKKIYYYTRIKYYDSDSYLKNKLDFINDFHNATLGENKTFPLEQYLETNGKNDSSLSNVTIYSSKKLVMWNKLKPALVTNASPIIKEFNIETAAIYYNYYVKIRTTSGTETYNVKEYYRVRYNSGQMYLLYFQRTLDEIYNPEFTSRSQSELKLGITEDNMQNMMSDETNKHLAFVRNGSLWTYDLSKNVITNVFSYKQNTDDYARDYYDQHDIRILNVSKTGIIDFVVYGYVNCGDYEGRVAILLYQYDPEENRITERIYIPLNTTYQQLNQDFGSFCYVNQKNIFYFNLYDTVYAYNITSRQYTVLTNNASSDNFAMVKSAKCFVWSNATKKKTAKSITILDLDSENQITISAKAGETIRVLGSIDSNIVYGFAKETDLYESTEGESITPVYKMIICNSNGEILKVYHPKKIYVTRTKAEDNIIHLKRVKRTANGFKKISEDSIQTQTDTSSKSFDITSRITDSMLTEKYITMPAGYLMKASPVSANTKYVMVTENTTLHLNDSQKKNSLTYYVYALGTITGSTKNAGEAIRTADEQMGVVMDSQSHIIWERGGRFLSKSLSLSAMDTTKSTTGISSIRACAHMLLKSAQMDIPVNELKGYSAMDMLRDQLENPVNLTGCTVDEILYFISNNKPVIAMKNDSDAVLITEYTSSSVTWYDPSTGSKTSMTPTNAENYFKNAGYIFFSFV